MTNFKLKLGVNECNNVEYHSDKSWLSSSSFKKVRKDSQKYYNEEILQLEQKREEVKDYLTEGSLTHSLILEPHLVAHEYAKFEGLRRTGSEWEVFKNLPENKNKVILTKNMWAKSHAYFRAYKENTEAVELINEGGLSEHTVCQMFNDIPTKVRADRINIEKGFIVDVKTSSFGVTRDEAEHTVRHWEYELSAALYCAVFEQFYNKPFDFFWIFISKTELECRVYKMKDTTRLKGIKMYKEGLEIYKKCVETGDWTKKTLDKQKQTNIEEI